jgi:5-methylcytosine-specific restriction endonuclease McrA
MRRNPAPYYDPRWRTIRRLVLERDVYACQLDLPKCRGRADSVHHVRDWRDGGAAFDPDNLVAVCVSCNTAERNRRTAARARAARGEPEKTYTENW